MDKEEDFAGRLKEETEVDGVLGPRLASFHKIVGESEIQFFLILTGPSKGTKTFHWPFDNHAIKRVSFTGWVSFQRPAKVRLSMYTVSFLRSTREAP